MNIPSFRSKAIYVSATTYAGLKAFADWQDVPSPDEIAEAWLHDCIIHNPKLKRFQAEQKKRMDALRAEAVDWPEKEQP